MNFISLEELSIKEIINLVKRALFFKNNPNLIPQLNLTSCLIFLEPSTRTRVSFQKALSLTSSETFILPVENSSFLKKETLEDTILTLKQLNISTFIIRSLDNYFYRPLLKIKGINIINAGAGIINHPSQSLLDLVTIYEHFKTFEQLKIAIVGDLNHSRVFFSNYKLFKRLNFEVFLCSYEKIKNYQNLSSYKTYNLNDIIESIDVIIFLRIQHERFNTVEEQNLVFKNPKSYNDLYGLNDKNYLLLKKNAIFLHPGPVNRDWEISSELIYAPKSKILGQVQNGLYARIAILEYISAKSIKNVEI